MQTRSWSDSNYGSIVIRDDSTRGLIRRIWSERDSAVSRLPGRVDAQQPGISVVQTQHLIQRIMRLKHCSSTSRVLRNTSRKPPPHRCTLTPSALADNLNLLPCHHPLCTLASPPPLKPPLAKTQPRTGFFGVGPHVNSQTYFRRHFQH